MSRASDYLLDLFFPTRCVYCDRVLDNGPQRLCGKCQQPWISPSTPLRMGKHFSRCVCAGWYQDTLRDAILRFKFKGESSYATVLAEPLAQCISLSLAGEFDQITWLPVSNKRLKARGYDQSFLLAEATAEILHVPLVSTLQKSHTRAQSNLSSAQARQENVTNVFSLVLPETVPGAHLLLIDDLITTGHTLDAACGCLLSGGAKSVVCACLARTPEDSPRYDDTAL